jgi:hypothetical protein
MCTNRYHQFQVVGQLIHCFCMLAFFATWASQFIRVTGRTTSTACPSTIRTIGVPFVCCCTCKRIKEHKSVRVHSIKVCSFQLQHLAQSGLVFCFVFLLTDVSFDVDSLFLKLLFDIIHGMFDLFLSNRIVVGFLFSVACMT